MGSFVPDFRDVFRLAETTGILQEGMRRKSLWEQEKERRKQEAELHQLRIEEAKDELTKRRIEGKQLVRSAQEAEARRQGEEALLTVPGATAGVEPPTPTPLLRLGPAPAPGGAAPVETEPGAPTAFNVPGQAPAQQEVAGIPELGIMGRTVSPALEAVKTRMAERLAQRKAFQAEQMKGLAGGHLVRLPSGEIVPAAAAAPYTLKPNEIRLGPRGIIARGPEEQPQVRTETSVDPFTGQPVTKTIVTRKGGVVSPPRAGADTAPPPAAAGLAPRAHAGADWDKTGEEFLSTLPPQVRGLVKKIGDYDQNPTALGRSQNRQALLAMAAQYNPDYDDKLYTQRRQTRLEFNSTKGGAGANIIALRTAVQHLGKLQDLAPGLAGGDVRALNELQNYAKTNFLGSPNVTNFQTAASAVESELASIMKKAGATDQEIKVWRENFGKNMSQRQIKGAVDTALDLMQGRSDALQESWHVSMGEKVPDFPIYGKRQQDILNKLRAPTQAGGPSAAAQPGTVRTFPDGTQRRKVPGGWVLVQ